MILGCYVRKGIYTRVLTRKKLDRCEILAMSLLVVMNRTNAQKVLCRIFKKVSANNNGNNIFQGTMFQ